MNRLMREKGQNQIAKGRITAAVIAGSMTFWLIANWLGPKFALSIWYAIMADLIVLASLFWALINCFFIWWKRQTKKGY